jgi:ClpP class serine protease
MTLSAPQASLSPALRSEIAYNGGNTIVPEINGAVATIEILGDIIGRAPWWAKAYMGAIDPFDVADAIDALAADPRISTLVIEMDCCGGTTCGTAEAAAAITRFQAAGKTVEVRVAGTDLVTNELIGLSNSKQAAA